MNLTSLLKRRSAMIQVWKAWRGPFLPKLFSTSAVSLIKGKPGKSVQKKSSQVKEVVLSWQISKNDLEAQKRKAIESILAKGSKLQIKLENKVKKFQPPSENELEARSILLEKVGKMVDAAGGIEAKPPQGNMRTRMMLYFAAK